VGAVVLLLWRRDPDQYGHGVWAALETLWVVDGRGDCAGVGDGY